MTAALALVRAVLAAGIPGAAVHPVAAATKTDVVELLNGDRITCEITKLERGKLVVKTDGAGTISIEWDDVERIVSAAAYDTFKSDIVGDLYWSINAFESYNSDPPSGRKSNDSGVSAAVGWSF